MKPNTRVVMRQIIDAVRASIPFGAPTAQLCEGACEACSVRLLEYLESELSEWERRLAAGEQPTLGELARFGRTCSRIHRLLERNGLSLAEPARPGAD